MTKTLSPVLSGVAAEAVASNITPTRQSAPINVMRCLNERLFTCAFLSLSGDWLTRVRLREVQAERLQAVRGLGFTSSITGAAD